MGYEKIALNAGWNMIGIQFAQVGGNSLATSTVGTLPADADGFDEEINFANEIQVWTGNGYRSYGWTGTSGTDVLEDDSFDNQWLNVDLEDDGSTLEPGEAVWAKASKATTVTVSGEVPENADSISLPVGWSMISYPLPKQVSLATFAMLSADADGFDEEINFANEIQVWTGNGYRSYGWTGTSGTDVLEDGSFDNQWLNVDLEDDGSTLSRGQGFWIKTAASTTLTFN